MARGGINKALVKQARDAVLAKGQYPSIDTVRIALGNTGSRTTIHRYLKELDLEEGARLDDEALLNDTLKDLVARLAGQLRQDAQNVVDEMENRHQADKAQWASDKASLDKALAEAQARAGAQEADVNLLQEQLSSTIEALQQSDTQSQRLQQRVNDFEALVAEKDHRIQSLEDKHQHHREALEHYRQSVKEQREQDQRRHETQVQQLQSEQRQLSQSLSLRLGEITELNRENSRLATETKELRKQLSGSQDAASSLEHQLKVSESRAAAADSKVRASQEASDKQAETLKAVQAQLADSEKEQAQLATKVIKLETELEIKNGFIRDWGTTTKADTNPALPT